jgi:hypothetical protein
MADRLLVISWGEIVRGREERAIAVFNETVGVYGRKVQDGELERFDVRLLGATSAIGGYFEIEGTSEQLRALKDDPWFQRNMAEAQLLVDGLRIAEGYCNEAVAEQMALYAEAIQKVAHAPQVR